MLIDRRSKPGPRVTAPHPQVRMSPPLVRTAPSASRRKMLPRTSHSSGSTREIQPCQLKGTRKVRSSRFVCMPNTRRPLLSCSPKDINIYLIKAFEWDIDQLTEGYDPLVFTAAIPGPNRPQHESHTSSSHSNPESSDFNLDDCNTHFTQDWAYSLDSQFINTTDVSNNILGSSWKDLSVDTFFAKPPTGAGPLVQPSAPNDAQRQLTELLGDLYADPYQSPMAFNINNTSNLNLHLMDVTVKAAHTLLSVIDSLQGSETTPAPPNSCPFSDDTNAAGSFVDAETSFLIAACYSRIFRNTNTLAIGLHNAVSSNDMSALRSMPSINIGSATPLYTTPPVIQSALWVQLLWQSVRELEKRLLTLSHSALLSPPTSELALRPLHRSHVHDLVRAVDADVAKLEVNVDHLLQTTLHTLRHKSI